MTNQINVKLQESYMKDHVNRACFLDFFENLFCSSTSFRNHSSLLSHTNVVKVNEV